MGQSPKPHRQPNQSRQSVATRIRSKPPVKKAVKDKVYIHPPSAKKIRNRSQKPPTPVVQDIFEGIRFGKGVRGRKRLVASAQTRRLGDGTTVLGRIPKDSFVLIKGPCYIGEIEDGADVMITGGPAIVRDKIGDNVKISVLAYEEEKPFEWFAPAAHVSDQPSSSNLTTAFNSAAGQMKRSLTPKLKTDAERLQRMRGLLIKGEIGDNLQVECAYDVDMCASGSAWTKMSVVAKGNIKSAGITLTSDETEINQEPYNVILQSAQNIVVKQIHGSDDRGQVSFCAVGSIRVGDVTGIKRSLMRADGDVSIHCLGGKISHVFSGSSVYIGQAAAKADVTYGVAFKTGKLFKKMVEHPRARMLKVQSGAQIQRDRMHYSLRKARARIDDDNLLGNKLNYYNKSYIKEPSGFDTKQAKKYRPPTLGKSTWR